MIIKYLGKTIKKVGVGSHVGKNIIFHQHASVLPGIYNSNLNVAGTNRQEEGVVVKMINVKFVIFYCLYEFVAGDLALQVIPSYLMWSHLLWSQNAMAFGY